MHDCCQTVVRSSVVVAKEFKVEVGLHQRSAMGPFLLGVVMDRLTDELGQGSPPWTRTFADDIVMGW